MVEPANDSFDPYYKWLGIPKKHRPPTHYQLLGVSPDESDHTIIEDAVERQKSHVGHYRGTVFDTAAARVLYELEEAETCLLNPEMRKEYERQLREKRWKKKKQATGKVRGAPPSIHGVGKGFEIVPTIFKIVGILLVACMIMATFSFQLPWQRTGVRTAETPVLPRGSENTEKRPVPVLPKGQIAKAVQHRTIRQSSLTLSGHTDAVFGVAFSPDGRRLASASPDTTVRLWDASSGDELFQLEAHDEVAYGVAFSSNGQQLASASRDRTIKIWDVATRQELFTLNDHRERVFSVAFSPDGKWLASASVDSTVKVWDVSTGWESFIEQPRLTLTGHVGRARDVAFSSDGQQLATAGDDKTVRIWDPATGRQKLELQGHTAYVVGVAFHPDGQRVASASHDATVKVWDLSTGEDLLTLQGHAT